MAVLNLLNDNSIDYQIKINDEVICNDEPFDILVDALKQHIESELTILKESSLSIPQLDVAQYILRVSSFFPQHIRQHDIMTVFYCDKAFQDFCERIINDYVGRGLIKLDDKESSPSINEVIKEYSVEIKSAICELFEYSLLESIRLTLDDSSIQRHIKGLYSESVIKGSVIEFEYELKKVQAEQSLCLTFEEQVDFLKAEYKSRIEIYKDRALRSKANFISTHRGLLPWQLFLQTNLNRTCEDFIEYQYFELPACLDLDLTLVSPIIELILKSDITELAAEWLVLEWIKVRLTSNRQSTPSPGSYESVELLNENSERVINSFGELLNDPDKLPQYIQALHSFRKETKILVIDEQGRFIDRKGNISIILAWTDTLKIKGKFKDDVSDNELAKLLNSQFPGLNSDIKDASIIRKSTNTKSKYQPHFLTLIK